MLKFGSAEIRQKQNPLPEFTSAAGL